MRNIFQYAKSIREKRAILKDLSKPLKEVCQLQGNRTLNEVLRAIYSQSGHVELKTLEQWNREGKKVKRGESALCLWGKPVQRESPDAENSTTGMFFPLLLVFSNLQVR